MDKVFRVLAVTVRVNLEIDDATLLATLPMELVEANEFILDIEELGSRSEEETMSLLSSSSSSFSSGDT